MVNEFAYLVADSDTVLEVDTAEPVIESVSEDVSTDNGSNITVVINNPSTEKDTSTVEDKDTIQEVVIREEDLILNSVTTETLRITANDTSGLKSVLLGVIGDYETVVTDYEYRNNNNTYYSHSIDIQPDYAWLVTAAIFTVCIYCCFRLYGLVFGRGRR